MYKRRYTKELLEKLTSESLTVRDVLRKLGVKFSSGTEGLVGRRIREYGIDISHFLGSRANCGMKHRGGRVKKKWEEVLIFRLENSTREKAYVLRRALIESGRPYRCEGKDCPVQCPQWAGKPLYFHVDHINGNPYDCRKENLRFLCPNCHSQTEGYCNSKGFTGIDARKSPRQKREHWDDKISQERDTRRFVAPADWRHRDRPQDRKVDRPSKEKLERMIETMPVLRIGKRYGVSDNAVRKWAKRYGLVFRKGPWRKTPKLPEVEAVQCQPQVFRIPVLEGTPLLEKWLNG